MVSWRQSICKDNENDASWRTSKKKVVKRKDFLLFMYFSLFIHAPGKKQDQALSVKSWGRGWQAQAQRTKEWDNDNFAIPINSKGVYTRMNICKILKDEGWL